jgi:hypothetical protein
MILASTASTASTESRRPLSGPALPRATAHLQESPARTG